MRSIMMRSSVGGANLGDEDFALLKCPSCPCIYLIEYEVDTLYTNPGDLVERIPVSDYPRNFNCITCGARFPETEAWIGPKAPKDIRVSWHQLSRSPWRWVTPVTRGGRVSQEA